MIRRATEEDTPSLRTLMARSNGYAPGPQREMIERYASTWAPTACEVWVMEDELGLAGFYQLAPSGADQELDLFFTADERQGQGVGRALFGHMAARAATLGATRVVIVSNPAAADFYRRMGARQTGMAAPGSGISWPRPTFELRLAQGA